MRRTHLTIFLETSRERRIYRRTPCPEISSRLRQAQSSEVKRQKVLRDGTQLKFGEILKRLQRNGYRTRGIAQIGLCQEGFEFTLGLAGCA